VDCLGSRHPGCDGDLVCAKSGARGAPDRLYEAAAVDLGHYARELASRPYDYGGHIVPHDAQAKELRTGKSRLEVLESLGLKNLNIAPQHRIEDGINAVRVLLPKCWFDAEKCARGIEALNLHRSDYDHKLRVLRPRPVHDWTLHAADAFRYLALTLEQTVSRERFHRKIVYPDLGIYLNALASAPVRLGCSRS
jgi:hypothetical protein